MITVHFQNFDKVLKTDYMKKKHFFQTVLSVTYNIKNAHKPVCS